MSKFSKSVLLWSATTVTGLLLIFYSGACAFLFLRQSQLIYTPTSAVQKPVLISLPYQEVWLSTPSTPDPQIYGWWIPAAAQEKGVVLYFHGAGHNLGSYQGDLKALHQMGFSVFATDY